MMVNMLYIYWFLFFFFRREIETNGFGTLEGDGSIGQILVHFPSQPGGINIIFYGY